MALHSYATLPLLHLTTKDPSGTLKLGMIDTGGSADLQRNVTLDELS
jgi:hypothetical protein